jgi:hypothetical protein
MPIAALQGSFVSQLMLLSSTGLNAGKAVAILNPAVLVYKSAKYIHFYFQ